MWSTGTFEFSLALSWPLPNPVTLPALTGDMLREQALARNKHVAGGLDGWPTPEIQTLPLTTHCFSENCSFLFLVVLGKSNAVCQRFFQMPSNYSWAKMKIVRFFSSAHNEQFSFILSELLSSQRFFSQWFILHSPWRLFFHFPAKLFVDSQTQFFLTLNEYSSLTLNEYSTLTFKENPSLTVKEKTCWL